MPYFFIKFSEEMYIDNLLYKGEVYMNSLDFITQCDSVGIGDANEKKNRLYPSGFYFCPKGQENNWYKLNNEGPVYFSINSPIGNIYCLSVYSAEDLLKKDPNSSFIDERMYEHGRYICFIRNPNEFINRIKKACDCKGYELDYKIVEYKAHDKEKHIPFEKDIHFSYQVEYRFFIKNTEGIEPIILEIGNLEDIAIKISPGDYFQIKIDNKADGSIDCVLQGNKKSQHYSWLFSLQ